MAKIIELILTQEKVGLGRKKDDPVRLKTQLWTKAGELVAEDDSVKGMHFNSDNLIPLL